MYYLKPRYYSVTCKLEFPFIGKMSPKVSVVVPYKVLTGLHLSANLNILLTENIYTYISPTPLSPSYWFLKQWVE